jgi:hypothetical protein
MGGGVGNLCIVTGKGFWQVEEKAALPNGYPIAFFALGVKNA